MDQLDLHKVNVLFYGPFPSLYASMQTLSAMKANDG